MNKPRVYSLDVFKLLLAYEVALAHLGIELPPSPGVAVDFFFILSGFFLGKKFYARSFGKGADGYSAWDYTLDHAKSIYPHFLFSLAVFFLYQLARTVIYFLMDPSLTGLWELGAYFFDQIPDLLMVHSSHYFERGLLFPTWQISATLIGGYFIYELLRQNEPLTRKIILPASLLMVRSAMVAGADYFENYGFIYMPLVRAFSAMGLGVLTWYFLGTKYCQALFRHPKAMNIGSLLAVAGLIFYTDRGRIFLILIPFLVITCYGMDCWLNRMMRAKWLEKAGKLSLAVFLNHSFIMRISETQIQPRTGITLNQLGVVYVIILTVYSIFTMYFVDWILKKWKKGA